MDTNIVDHILLFVMATIFVMQPLCAKTISPSLMASNPTDNLSKMADLPNVNFNSSPNPQFTGGYNKIYDKKQQPIIQVTLPSQPMVEPTTQLLPIQTQLQPPFKQYPSQNENYITNQPRPPVQHINYVPNGPAEGYPPPPSYYQRPNVEPQDYPPYQQHKPLPTPPLYNTPPNAYDSIFKHFK